LLPSKLFFLKEKFGLDKTVKLWDTYYLFLSLSFEEFAAKFSMLDLFCQDKKEG